MYFLKSKCKIYNFNIIHYFQHNLLFFNISIFLRKNIDLTFTALKNNFFNINNVEL